MGIPHRKCGDTDSDGRNCCRNVMLEPGTKLLKEWRFQCRLDRKAIGSIGRNNDWREHKCHHRHDIDARVKTFAQWQASNLMFDAFVAVGDAVGEEMVVYFAEVVPGGVITADFAQCGEASRSDDNNTLLYTTFRKDGEVWRYVGDCPAGEEAS